MKNLTFKSKIIKAPYKLRTKKGFYFRYKHSALGKMGPNYYMFIKFPGLGDQRAPFWSRGLDINF